jgi:hypothetical protein
MSSNKASPFAKPTAEFVPQSLQRFLEKPLPPKEPLIEGILYRRDRISLTGRRRNGKTTLIHNLALAGAAGLPQYLGFTIPRVFRVLSFYLEDDARELQDKLGRMRGRLQMGGDPFHLYTREDLWVYDIQISAKNQKFREFVQRACDACKPDLVIFDNLAHLIGADYNNPEKVHELMLFMFALEHDYNAATLIAAHPRKGTQLNHNAGVRISLRDSPEQFFEECMGSSHFINSTGSLWGIERDHGAVRSDLLLGTQRLTGTHSFTVVDKSDDDWFERVDDLKIAADTLINTAQRRHAWDLMARAKQFDYKRARELTRPAMKSDGSFNPWWNDLRRQGLILEVGKEYRCAEVPLQAM